ncbi:MAG: arylsulfatase [Bacteroidales bacterium]
MLFVLFDDTGLGACSPYGGGINMPTLDKLASEGLTYTQWNNTALCSPTRATLLTGRNHHLNGMATITEGAAGFPGMSGIIPDNCVPMAKLLRDQGYSTFWLGKNHSVPVQDISAGGNLKNWPLGMGFDHFYGFLGGETNNWYPDLVEDNQFVPAPATPEEGYHFSKDIADKAISYLQDLNSSNPGKPWYMWLNPGANHAPHHSPKEYADKYKGMFDDGYEAYREWVVQRMKEKGIVPESTELTALNPMGKKTLMPEMVRPWASLSADEKKLFSRMAEVYAGFSEYTDVQIGRIIDYLKATGQYENTVIFWAADNGTSGEGTPNGSVNENKMFNSYPDDLADNLKLLDELGGPNTYNHMPTGWAAAFNGPLKMFKRYAYAGGVNCPLVISWPAGIKSKGELRHQYHHSVDIVPTILELAGIEMPEIYQGVEQQPLSGVSMAYSFDAAPDGQTQKDVQYYAMLGTRGIWQNGWKAITTHPAMAGTGDFQNDTWELYHTDIDRSEAKNLADEYPEKLEALKTLWMEEAQKNSVFPIDDRSMAQMVDEDIKRMSEHPELITNTYTFYPFSSPISEGNSIMIRGRDFKLLANVEITDNTEGVIFAHGSRFGGHSLFVKGGKLHYVYNFLGIQIQEFTSNVPLRPGKHVVGLEFKKEGVGEKREVMGRMKMYIGEQVVAEGPLITQSGIFSLSGEGICIGYDNGDVVSTKYKAPGKFKNGAIQHVILNATGSPYLDVELEMKRAWITQ